MITRALFGQWAHFQSERYCYRYAERHLQPVFPALLDRAQFNRLLAPTVTHSVRSLSTSHST